MPNGDGDDVELRRGDTGVQNLGDGNRLGHSDPMKSQARRARRACQAGAERPRPARRERSRRRRPRSVIDRGGATGGCRIVRLHHLEPASDERARDENADCVVAGKELAESNDNRGHGADSKRSSRKCVEQEMQGS